MISRLQDNPNWYLRRQRRRDRVRHAQYRPSSWQPGACAERIPADSVRASEPHTATQRAGDLQVVLIAVLFVCLVAVVSLVVLSRLTAPGSDFSSLRTDRRLCAASASCRSSAPPVMSSASSAAWPKPSQDRDTPALLERMEYRTHKPIDATCRGWLDA
jgi:hypothetical protein